MRHLGWSVDGGRGPCVVLDEEEDADVRVERKGSLQYVLYCVVLSQHDALTMLPGRSMSL